MPKRAAPLVTPQPKRAQTGALDDICEELGLCVFDPSKGYYYYVTNKWYH
jgi:hypothetical protein